MKFFLSIMKQSEILCAEKNIIRRAVIISCMSFFSQHEVGKAQGRQLTFGLMEELANEYHPGRLRAHYEHAGTRAVIYKGVGEWRQSESTFPPAPVSTGHAWRLSWPQRLVGPDEYLDSFPLSSPKP